MEQLSHKRKITVMAAITVCMFFSSINQTIVGVALPTIIAKLGGMEYYTWVITIYFLTSTICTILVGKLSDIYGRKYFILTGIVLFMTGALLAGTAKDIIQLIVYRGIQGAGAGIIMATAFTAVGDLFSPRERGRWSGFLSAILGVASVLGPGLGGYIVDNLEWRWVFWIFLPLGVIAFFMILLLFPKTEKRPSQSIDYVGSLLLVFTIVPLLLAFTWAGTKYSWGSAQIIGLFTGTTVALLLFLFTETKVKTPVLPLYIFKSSVVSISIVISFIMNAGMMGALTYMAFYVQGAMGVPPTYAGYVTMPMSVFMFAASAFAGRQMTKTGKYRNIAVVGAIAMVIGMSVMVFMNNIPVAVISMIIFGVGLGLCMPVFTLAVQNAVDESDLGVSTASVQLFRNLGSTIGIAVMGTVFATGMAKRMGTTVHNAEGLLHTTLTPELSNELIGYMEPELLLNAVKVSSIRGGLTDTALPAFNELLDLLRQALASSLSMVFLLGAAVLVVALILTFFLKELPLRTSDKAANSKE